MRRPASTRPGSHGGSASASASGSACGPSSSWWRGAPCPASRTRRRGWWTAEARTLYVVAPRGTCLMSLAMTKEEREAFLADTHVAVVSIADGERGPLAVPIWYAYTPGDALRFVTGGESRKARLIRATGRVSVCVQTETPPSRCVPVEDRAPHTVPAYRRDHRPPAPRCHDLH